MCLCLGTAFQAVYREGVYMKLGNLVACANQPEKLSFGCLQCCIGHHIEQADMHFPNILMTCALRRQYFFTFFVQAFKCR